MITRGVGRKPSDGNGVPVGPRAVGGGDPNEEDNEAAVAAADRCFCIIP